MYSKAHGAISLVIGIGLVAAGVEFVHPAVVVGYAVAAGVGIDFDHFLWARYNTGDWSALRGVLASPASTLADQSTIFGESDLSELQRLLSHAVVVGLAVPATWLVSPDLGLTTAVVLYGHVLSDLLADVRAERRRASGG